MEQITHQAALVLPYSTDKYLLTQKDEGYVHPSCWILLGGNFFYDMRQKEGHDKSPLETIKREIAEELGAKNEIFKEDLATIVGGTSEKIAKSDANFKESRIPEWAALFMASSFGTEVISNLVPERDYVLRVSEDYVGRNGKPPITFITSLFSAYISPENFKIFERMSERAKKEGAKLSTEGEGLFPIALNEITSLEFGWGQDQIVEDFLSSPVKRNDKIAVESLGHKPLESYDAYLEKYKDTFTFRGA